MTWKCTNTPKGEDKLYSDARGVVPSLDLRFAEGKNLNDYMTGTPLVDHQRSMSGSNLSAGTFVNSSGLIETAKVNLLPYSKDNLGWSTQDMNNDGAVEGPPGEGQATRFTSVGGTVASRVRYLSAFTTTAGVQYTLSIYVKPLNYNSVSFGLSNIGAGASRSDYNFSTGIVTNAAGTADASMEALGNGWWRLKNTIVAAPSSGSIPTLFLDLGDTAAETHATSEGFDVYGGQIEEGVDLNTYIQTIGVPSAAPRFDHDPTTGESLGLLVEESRTNLVTYSEQFDNAAWVKSGDLAVTADQTVAPDATTTADLLTCSNAGLNRVTNLVSVSASTDYTATVFVKSGDRTHLGIRLYIFGGTVVDLICNFEFASGTFSYISGPGTLSATPYPNGWYRLTITIGTGNNTSLEFRLGGAYINEGTGTTAYLWGAQLEVGSFPTSYIPTTTTALTRSADVASITGSNFSSWYNQSEGSIYAESNAYNLSSLSALFSANDGSFSNRITSTPLTYGLFIATNNAIQVSINAGGAWNPGQVVKAGFGIAVNDFSVVLDGSTLNTDNSGSIPVVDRLNIGRNAGNTSPWNGTISRLTYFPERLPDATLQAITAS